MPLDCTDNLAREVKEEETVKKKKFEGKVNKAFLY
jgi:hypothetical protein